MSSALLDDRLFSDTALLAVRDKVVAAERLDRDDALAVAVSDDLLGVGRLANHVREAQHGNTTYFNINRHLNPTNVCVATCGLCAFYVPFGEAHKGWTYAVEEAVDVAARDIDPSVAELHIVGGLHPKLGVDYYCELFRALKRRFPWIHLKALTMVEFDFMAKIGRTTVEAVIEQLVDAGLDSCPGGGAEIFAEEVRDQICDHKTDGSSWLEISGKVHAAGIKTNATMLYGHVESAAHRVDHLLALREQQDESGGFQCLIPLAFHPENTVFSHLPPTSAKLDLQTIALSRLVLDNFDHIKAYWIMLGLETAQMALHFGANDLDGTIVDERITYAAGGTAGRGMTVARLEAVIRETGRTPVLRDTLYNPLERPAQLAAAVALS